MWSNWTGCGVIGRNVNWTQCCALMSKYHESKEIPKSKKRVNRVTKCYNDRMILTVSINFTQKVSAAISTFLVTLRVSKFQKIFVLHCFIGGSILFHKYSDHWPLIV